MAKTCGYCGVEFNIPRANYCSRSCGDRARYARDESLRKRQAAANRKWADRNPERQNEYTKRYQAKHGYGPPADPVKVAARQAVKCALERGALTRGSCERADEDDCRGRLEAHHDDYDKPLEVRWLCSRHHGLLHRAVTAA